MIGGLFIQGSAMKAIETEYNGYRFRSRLEARWAVALDEMGVEWQYEHEGFDLDGVYYLPDFYLPDDEIPCLGEVKASRNGLSEDELIKIRKLAYYSRMPVVLFTSITDTDEYIIFEYDPWSDDGHFESGVMEIHQSLGDLFGTDLYLNAVKAARSARFEHG